MQLYHVNSKGEPGPCNATIACPFGDESRHYPSLEAARAGYEARVELVQAELASAQAKVQDLEDELEILEDMHNAEVERLKKNRKRDPGDPEAVRRRRAALPPMIDELRQAVHAQLYWEKQAIELGLMEPRERPLMTAAAKRADRSYKDSLRAKAVFKKPMAVGPYRQLINELTAWSGLHRDEVKNLLRSYSPQSGMTHDEYMVHLFQTYTDTVRDRVFVDLETTSLHPTTGEIIEIGLLRVGPDGTVKATVDERFNMEDEFQRDNVGVGPSHVHKIEAEDIRDLPTFRDPAVQARLAEHLNDPNVIIVAHNATFENAWFDQNLDGYYEAHNPASASILSGDIEAPRMQDTRTLAMLLGHELPNTSLEKFTEGNGIKYEDAHSAFPDAAMTWRAFEEFKRRTLTAEPGKRPSMDVTE